MTILSEYLNYLNEDDYDSLKNIVYGSIGGTHFSLLKSQAYIDCMQKCNPGFDFFKRTKCSKKCQEYSFDLLKKKKLYGYKGEVKK
jgi:hypothetical protein